MNLSQEARGMVGECNPSNGGLPEQWSPWSQGAPSRPQCGEGSAGGGRGGRRWGTLRGAESMKVAAGGSPCWVPELHKQSLAGGSMHSGDQVPAVSFKGSEPWGTSFETGVKLAGNIWKLITDDVKTH